MFGEALRALRRRINITQVALAKELDVTQQTIGKWETDVVTPPFETIVRIAKFFNVPVEYFVEGFGKEADIASTNDSEQELSEKQIKAIVDMISLLEVRNPEKGVIELSPDYCVLVEKVLRENDEVMRHAFSIFSLVLDALVIGSLELSKINLNMAIARISKEPFDSEAAIHKARERVSEKIAPSTIILSKIMSALPEAFFGSPPPESAENGGDPDAEHNKTPE